MEKRYKNYLLRTIDSYIVFEKHVNSIRSRKKDTVRFNFIESPPQTVVI